MDFNKAVEVIRKRLIAAGKPSMIPTAIGRLKNKMKARTEAAVAEPDLAYLEGADREGYLHDMDIAQKWADLNRTTIAARICEKMGWLGLIDDSWTTEHNYIASDNIIRKSAISAKKGQKVLIPLNMRDGSIIGIGKGNDDWNQSAPHGAGRRMSRAKARAEVDMKAYEDSMKGIFTTSVSRATIDEAPQAYKPSKNIIAQIADTVDVVEVIKPVYNFKAAE